MTWRHLRRALGAPPPADEARDLLLAELERLQAKVVDLGQHLSVAARAIAVQGAELERLHATKDPR